MNTTPTQPATIGWDLMLEAGMICTPWADTEKRREGLKVLRQHTDDILSIASLQPYDPEGFKFNVPTPSGARYRFSILPELDHDTSELIILFEVQQPLVGTKPRVLADKTFTVPLTWCPLRKAWVGRILMRNGDHVRNPQDPNGPLVRHAAEEEIAATLARAWRWAVEQAK